MAVVMCIERNSECVNPTFIIGSGRLTRALVSPIVQPAVMSNAKYPQNIKTKFENSFVLTKQSYLILESLNWATGEFLYQKYLLTGEQTILRVDKEGVARAHFPLTSY